MKAKYAAILLGGLLVAATLLLVFCSDGKAPDGFDPTQVPNDSQSE